MPKIGATKKQRKKSAIEKDIQAELRRIAIKRHPYCVTCKGRHGDPVLQGGHLVSRRKKSTKYDLMNVFTQCRSCNNIHNTNPHIFVNWFIGEYGVEEYQDLVKRSMEVKQYKLTDLIDILEELRKIK